MPARLGCIILRWIYIKYTTKFIFEVNYTDGCIMLLTFKETQNFLFIKNVRETILPFNIPLTD